MNSFLQMISLVLMLSGVGCASLLPAETTPADAAKLDRKLVKDAVVYEQGAKDGAVVPEISSPQLRAIMVPERVENNRLIEAHREWILDGEVSLLGIPRTQSKTIGGKRR